MTATIRLHLIRQVKLLHTAIVRNQLRAQLLANGVGFIW